MKEHYRNLFREHGDSPMAVQWSDHASQFNRFRVLSDIAREPGNVTDVGCGLGHFYEFLKKERNFSGKYLGLDIVPEFIEAAQKKFVNDPNASFSGFDIRREDIPEGADHIFLCGVFNNTMDDNESFMYMSIEKMFRAAKKGIAFNAMSTYVDYQSPGLYYTDPLQVFDFCKKNITKRITLRHDYLVKENSIPFEYTMYLYK